VEILICTQVQAATALGIPAVQLTQQTMQDIPHIIERIKAGEFRLLFMVPEFCQQGNRFWKNLINPKNGNTFCRRVICIAIDEAHLIQQWRSFRVQYTHFGSLRFLFSQAAYLLCSATMAPHTRRFVHRTMNLGRNVSLVHRSVDRPNVFLSMRCISGSVKNHSQLYFLIPPGISHPGQIPQTIVFIDSRPEAQAACSEFWKLVPPEWATKSEYAFVFCECCTILTVKRRWLVMNAFKTGLCRVLFATEVAGMGVDFPHVERVVQWRVGNYLNVSAILQRLGRASRRPGTQGLFILFHTKRYFIKEEHASDLGIFHADASQENDDRVSECIAAVEAWATGAERLQPPVNPEDRPVIPYTVSDEVAADDGNEDASIIGPDDLEHDNSEGPRDDQDTHNNSDNDTESEDESSAQTHGRKRRVYPSCCRGISWMINTEGCRRAVMLTLFEDPGFNAREFELERSLPTCCDRHLTSYCQEHADPNHQPEDVRQIRRLLPPEPVSDSDAGSLTPGLVSPDGSIIGDTQDIQHAATRRASNKQRSAVKTALRDFRIETWEKISNGNIFMPYPPHKFLPDSSIEKLARNCCSLVSAADIEACLAGPTDGLGYLRKLGFLPSMLEVIVQTVNDTAHKPNPVGRKRMGRRPYIPLHDIAPDADANDPVVIQKRRENEAARLAHETLEDAKERQRAKAREYAALRKARSQNTSTQDASASQAPLLSSEEVSESNPFAQLAHDAPG
jgi:hypothetical protein